VPTASALACPLLGIEGLTVAVGALFTAGPISASSDVLARQLGGDAPLIAGLITLTTIAAAHAAGAGAPDLAGLRNVVAHGPAQLAPAAPAAQLTGRGAHPILGEPLPCACCGRPSVIA
jgi:hypothetical protein